MSFLQPTTILRQQCQVCLRILVLSTQLMMYSATLLASLLASAYGFGSIPGVTCSADEEKFFVYSTDPSLVFPFVATAGGPDFTSDESVTRGLVGNTWQGLQLSITQGDTTITQAGGKPLTVTSPNTLDGGRGFNFLSEDFCLGYGNWTVNMTAPTHPEMASYGTFTGYPTLEERLAPDAPVDWAAMPQASREWGLDLGVDVHNFGNNALCNASDPSSPSDPSDPTNCVTFAPFLVRWAIFPAEMRADAEAAAAIGLIGMSFIEDNEQKAWAFCEVDVELDVVVPAYLRRRRLSVGGSASRCG